uniref:Uncharacterized protein n=1 Tax=Ixodes scapularis TaxID=6945 RepID=A0A4D5RFX9_IXOSC
MWTAKPKSRPAATMICCLSITASELNIRRRTFATWPANKELHISPTFRGRCSCTSYDGWCLRSWTFCPWNLCPGCVVASTCVPGTPSCGIWCAREPGAEIAVSSFDIKAGGRCTSTGHVSVTMVSTSTRQRMSGTESRPSRTQATGPAFWWNIFVICVFFLKVLC